MLQGRLDVGVLADFADEEFEGRGDGVVPGDWFIWLVEESEMG